LFLVSKFVSPAKILPKKILLGSGLKPYIEKLIKKIDFLAKNGPQLPAVFLIKTGILIKNRNFVQKAKFSSKIEL